MHTGARSIRIGHITMSRSGMRNTGRRIVMVGKGGTGTSAKSLTKLRAIWGGIGIGLKANRGWSGSGPGTRRRMRGIEWRRRDEERIDRSQKSEVRGQRSEVRSQKSEVRGQKLEEKP